MNDFAQIIDKQIQDVAEHAVSRQTAITMTAQLAAEELSGRIAEATGIFPEAKTMSAMERDFAAIVGKTLAAAEAKGYGTDSMFTTSGIQAHATSLAQFQWDMHSHKIIAKQREKNEQIAEADRKAMPSASSVIDQRLTGAPAAQHASLPLLTGAAALLELENRGKQYPARKGKR